METKVHHPFILGTVVLALTVCSGFSEANAGSRSGYQTYSARTGYYPRNYGYPRPGCTFAIREYQRRWPYQLWPPSMRCAPFLTRLAHEPLSYKLSQPALGSLQSCGGIAG